LFGSALSHQQARNPQAYARLCLRGTFIL
jgi:hypothetical protein